MKSVTAIELKRHYVLVAAFALSFFILALIFLFAHTVILKEK